MNWLQKIAQADEDEGYLKAQEYFNIGHGDFVDEIGFAPTFIVWAYINGEIQAGPEGVEDSEDIGNPLPHGGTHGTLWGHHITDRSYKGRYEPQTGRLSIVKPKHLEMYDIPQSVMDALNEKFGFIGKVRVF